MAIEQYIKQKLENYQKQPPQKVWKNIQAQIARPWYKTLWFKSIATIIAITVITIISVKIAHKRETYPVIQPAKNPDFSTVISRQPFNGNSTKPNTGKNVSYSNSKNSRTLNLFHRDTLANIQAIPDHALPSQQAHDQKLSFSAPLHNKKLNFKLAITPHQGCAPLKIKMSVEPPENMNVSWFVDQIPISEDKNAEYTLKQGIHFIQLAIFDTMQTILVYDTVIVYPRPSAAFDAEKCKAGDTLIIKNLSMNATSYKWNFGDGQVQDKCEPVHIYTRPGLYNITLIASNGHCSDTAHKTINVEKKAADIIFPNAFVPDINGPNGGYYNPNKPQINIFHPVTNKPVKDYNLKIFDRRGKLIFETNDINRGWDGYYRNKLVPIGVYIYLAQGRFEDGDPFTVKGDITVIYRR